MKRIIVVSFALFALMACGGNDSKDKKDAKAENTSSGSDLSSNPDYQKGLELVSNNNCPTCHKVDEALTGPPFKDIANKYANGGDSAIAYLSNKIINGGSGVWGQVPMTPHPELKPEQATAIVKYILLLKGK